MNERINVIDLFAGPGGLGEGFSSLKESFRIKLSIEKDPCAHKTLNLRSFYRQFQSPPPEYYGYLKGEITKEELFRSYPEESLAAHNETWCCELGVTDHQIVKKRITEALAGNKNWILIGGPPCQAYSLAGRSRMKTVDLEKFESDKRHFLYQEYLRIIADHMPPIFVMENVKGLVSSTVKGEHIFAKILNDLRKPRITSADHDDNSQIDEYNIYSLVVPHDPDKEYNPGDYIICAEEYGVPQARHRVILIGIRKDLNLQPKLLEKKSATNVSRILSDLPPLRSGLSKEKDSFASWLACLNGVQNERWFQSLPEPFVNLIKTELEKASAIPMTKGGNFITGHNEPEIMKEWFYDSDLKGVLNHESRSHIREDLHRYFFASLYGKVKGISPKLKNFPVPLLPKHKNIDKALKTGLFSDRFRVQIGQKYATTITSHISKDGHYYIHPDPYQCRSLTVREAARIQTFPNNYYFEGPRTSQYQQVGNA